MRGVRVLVVDDNGTNRRVLEELLKRWGATTELASSAQGTLAAMRQARSLGHAFHIVLTDAQMPDVDGFMLAQQIKADPELTGAIVMMLSSCGLRGEAARAPLKQFARLPHRFGSSCRLGEILHAFNLDKDS